jgi:tight adherence protein C
VVAGALRATLQDVAVGGRPLGAALEAMAAREGVAEFATVAGHLRAVQEQGLPLASSLAALADGLREGKRVRLQAEGGRATVRMLVPIAVLILPVVAVVLIYPALAEIWGSLT